MKYPAIGMALSALWLLRGTAALADSDTTLDEIVVTASLRPTSVAELPQSVSVLDAATLRDAGVQHFEDVLGMIPNLNWAAGTTLPRFFQLRGIGEVEQYQGAPNPSVGFLIDDIDFSGVGMPATLFDTQQIEVLRGPQGTIYGANALAGLISVHTADPGSGFELHGEVTAADYDTRSAGLVIGDGSADGHLGWRLAAQQYYSDGFRHNAFYDMNSTNGLDEGTLRGKLHWQFSDALQADLTLMHMNIDNGYDAWSVHNTFTTYSNQPGRDAQLSNGAALRLIYTIDGLGQLHSVSSAADSHIVYSFDDDWGNDPFWLATTGYAPYDYYQSDDRSRRTLAEDLRLIGDPSRALFGRINWLLGVYALRMMESDHQVYTWNAYDAAPDGGPGAGSSGLNSEYGATNLALYGSLDASLGPRTTLSGGLRLERRNADYADSADATTPFPEQINSMVGGNLSWMHLVADGEHLYATLARGYKGGGYNIGSGILSEQRSFGPESLWSVESGLKYQRAASALSWDTDVFYMRRQHMQVYLSEQLQQNNPLEYLFFTQNAADGENFGWEAQGSYRPDSNWQFSGSAALLHTRYLGVGGAFESLDIDGRAQPFAPGYEVSAAIEYHLPSGWFARLDSHAIDSFYYYSSDAQTSRSYHLENLRLGYRRGAWTASVWARNLLDVRYAQQGFYFGLIPPNYPNQAFLQLGDPRQVGVTIRYDLGSMSRNVRVFQVDAFTSQRFCGNPAGVVLDADALTAAEMQSLARELNNGDTVFLSSPDGTDHDVRARFFTPRREAAFVGHATLAAHAVLAQLGLPPRPRQKQSSGIVTVRTQAGVPARIAISQPPPPLGRALTAAELEAILAALSLGPAELDRSCPPLLAGPATRALLGVATPQSLQRLRPDFGQLAALSAQIGAAGFFLFTLLGSTAQRATEARMFCPALGMPEDPVSGNAHAMLGVYLLHHNLIMLEAAGFEGDQGHHMGRPGRVQVSFERDGAGLRAVAICGQATIVFATSVDFP